jgi:putative transposase
MREKTRDLILEKFLDQLKGLIKGLLERLMLEERELYLQEHPTKGNGYYTRDLLTLFGSLEDLKVPRVREGGFHPKVLPYRRRASIELSEAILILYAMGVSTRDISRFLESIYGAFYSPQSISRLTQVVEEEVKEWRARSLDEEYYAVYLDCTFLAVRRGKTAKEPVYIALGIKPDGRREVLGFWVFGAEGESAQNWRTVLKGLWERGVKVVKVFISDDLPGVEEAVREMYPGSKWQLCVLHMVRDSLAKARKADREALAQDLKTVYRADTIVEAHEALRVLEERWAGKYPELVAKWVEKSYALLEFLEHPKPIRPYLYTTNQLERLMKEVKRRTKIVEVFCGPEALGKLLYLVLVQENEKLSRRRLRGFAEIQMGSCHASGHTC